MYEVELKFPVADHAPIIAALTGWKARPGTAVEQRDSYFNHPQRDFARTDEALRIRSVGEKNFVTYKGPVLDSRTKTRREIEIPIGDGRESAVKFGEVLTLLGFRAVRTVGKTRIAWHLCEGGRDFEIALDRVADLGLFVEIETQAPEAGRDAARDAVLDLAQRLGLSLPERRSYLCLLLAMDGAGSIQ